MIKLWNTEIIIKVIKQEKIIGGRVLQKLLRKIIHGMTKFQVLFKNKNFQFLNKDFQDRIRSVVKIFDILIKMYYFIISWHDLI